MKTRKCLALLMAAVLLCGTLAGSASAASQPSDTSAGSEERKQLTMEDIRKLNGGDVRYSTDAEGNITFLAGKFYDGKIENGDGVEKALWGMHKLIGADENTVYQKGNGIRLDNGYTYYTLQQWHGEMAVENAIVKIIVDPNGEAAAISSSVQAGIDAGTEMVISPEEAVKRVRAHLAETDPETAYTFYEDRVEKATVSYDGSFYNTITPISFTRTTPRVPRKKPTSPIWPTMSLPWEITSMTRPPSVSEPRSCKAAGVLRAFSPTRRL